MTGGMSRGAAAETTLQAPYREEETGPHSGRSHCRWIDDARPFEAFFFVALDW